MKRDIIVIGVLALIILAGAILFSSYSGGKGALIGVKDMGRDEGVVTLAFGESAKFGGITIAPLELIEDSRCAIDVVCVWAGTVRLKLSTVSGLGMSELALELGKSMTTETEEVRFVSVSPSRKGSEPIPEADYRFTLEVMKRSADEIGPPASTPTPVTGRCYVGGCSSQICSDQQGVVSDCMFRPEYSCYQGAKCERQTNGQCGWTETSELKMCLQNPPSL